MLEFSTDINESLFGLNGPSGDRNALEHLVRIFINNLTIFKCTRLRFVGINHEVAGLTRFTVEEFPFHACGETSTPTTAQTRNFYLFANFIRLHRDSLFKSFVAAMFQVAIEVDAVTWLAQIGVNKRTFDGGHFIK